MKKKLIIIVLMLLVIGGIYVIVGNRQTSSQDSGLAPNGTTVIQMTDDTYEPSEITIKKGTTVTFVNKSKDWRWPASNLHPTHDIYPQFDPKEPVASGKSWSFRFDQAGAWRMHDHLAPYITGTITVKP